MSHRLRSQESCRVALAWVWKLVEEDDPSMPIQKAKTLVYIALSISQILRDSDLEARLEKLEQAAKHGRRAA